MTDDLVLEDIDEQEEVRDRIDDSQIDYTLNTEGAKCSLSILLALCTNADPADVYNNYMRGFKLLHKWLSPIAFPQNNSIKQIHWIFRNYEIQEMSKYLGCTQEYLYTELLLITLNKSL